MMSNVLREKQDDILIAFYLNFVLTHIVLQIFALHLITKIKLCRYEQICLSQF